MWYGISGSWRTTNQQVEDDVRRHVQAVLQNGHGIVSGGALGVDYFATDEALKHGADHTQLKIILPTPKSVFFAHFRQAAIDNKITSTQAETLIEQITEVDNRGALQTMDHTACNPTTYYDRNQKVIDASDALLAFHVNATQGTQDAIDKAREQDMDITLMTYRI